MTRADRVAVEAYAAMYPQRIRTTGGATVLTIPEAPDSPMLNRIVGLGVDEPATEFALDEALAAVEQAGVARFYVALHPDARPAELSDWLRARGLEPGWGWMLFTRDVADPPEATTDLDVHDVGPGDAAGFARVVRIAYGLPEAIEQIVARQPEIPGWHVFTADSAGEAVAAAAIYVADGVGYLGFAATLPEHRGRGGQGALLAARIRRARELGCDLLVTETGERRDDLPSNSYRNILRAGFTEAGVVANWLGQRS